jgi:hypothetical protein
VTWERLPKVPGRKCSFPGCDRKHDSRLMCSVHRKQLDAGIELHPIKARPFSPLPPDARPVPSWPGLYATPAGEIWSARLGKGTRRMCPVIATRGYLSLVTVWSGRRRSVRVHVLVAEAFLGPRPPGMDINHKDAVKTNNRPENLEYVTHTENMRHAARMGLMGRRKAA